MFCLQDFYHAQLIDGNLTALIQDYLPHIGNLYNFTILADKSTHSLRNLHNHPFTPFPTLSSI